MPSIAVLIVAAGKGERAGTELPKQYERLAGKPMLRRTVEAFFGYPVQVVIGSGTGRTCGAMRWRVFPCPRLSSAARRGRNRCRLGLEALAAGRARLCADP